MKYIALRATDKQTDRPTARPKQMRLWLSFSPSISESIFPTWQVRYIPFFAGMLVIFFRCKKHLTDSIFSRIHGLARCSITQYLLFVRIWHCQVCTRAEVKRAKRHCSIIYQGIVRVYLHEGMFKSSSFLFCYVRVVLYYILLSLSLSSFHRSILRKRTLRRYTKFRKIERRKYISSTYADRC